jgi:ketosteroid isomerase-like protein
MRRGDAGAIAAFYTRDAELIMASGAVVQAADARLREAAGTCC